MVDSLRANCFWATFLVNSLGFFPNKVPTFIAFYLIWNPVFTPEPFLLMSDDSHCMRLHIMGTYCISQTQAWHNKYCRFYKIMITLSSFLKLDITIGFNGNRFDNIEDVLHLHVFMEILSKQKMNGFVNSFGTKVM